MKKAAFLSVILILCSCGKTDPQMATEEELNISPNSIASKQEIIFGADYESNKVYTYKVDESGKLSKIDVNIPGSAGHPFSLGLSGDKKTLYVGKATEVGKHDSPNLISFKIQDSGMKLAPFQESLAIDPEEHPRRVSAISSVFESPDGKTLYAVSRDHGTNIFQKNQSERIIKKKLESVLSDIKDVRPTPDGKYLAYQIRDKVLFWPADINEALIDRSESSAFYFETEEYLFLDSDTVLSAGPSYRLNIYDINIKERKKTEVSDVYWGSDVSFYDLALVNNSILAIGKGSSGSYLKSFKFDNGEISLVDTIDIKEWPQSLQSSRNGKYAVVSTRGENKLISVKVESNGELEKIDETTVESYFFDLLVL